MIAIPRKISQAREVTIQLLETPADLARYDTWVQHHAQGTLWQSAAWVAYRQALGNTVRVYAALEDDEFVATALVVLDTTAFGLSTWDIPRGPLWTDDTAAQTLLERIVDDARTERCLSLTFSPTVSPPLFMKGSKSSKRHEQPEATRILDLTLSDDDLLAQMKPKGRYNIRVANKHDVRVAPSTDIAAYYNLAKSTGARDAFGIPPQKQLSTFLSDLEESFLLLAFEGTSKKPIAGLLGVVWNGRGIYYYGASDHAHRALMAPYALQWQAIQHCKTKGATEYDLLGVAPPDANASHSWQGITSFKEKFGGELVTYPPEQERVLRPVAKKILSWKRKLWR